MKHILKATFFAFFLAIATPALSTPMKSPVTTTTAAETEELKRLEERLTEISKMDVQSMSRPERKAMRKEVKSIKKKMDSSGGIYLSAGAVILIVVLLIILL